MVGERYRDLLAAADSIVRMRTAADNLVDRLESAEDSLSHAGVTPDGERPLPLFFSFWGMVTSAQENLPPFGPTRALTHTHPHARTASPSKRRQSLRSLKQLGPPHPDQDPRSLSSSSTTVAHTVQLLLAVPSLVHAKLDAADYLGAARLEELGQVVYRTLVQAEVDLSFGGSPEREEDEEAKGAVIPTRKRKLTEVFPLIEKQAEPLAALGPLVLRRALVALHDWEADTTASCLSLPLIPTHSALANSLLLATHRL
jgi:hypothetical protein